MRRRPRSTHRYDGLAPNRVHVYPFGVDLELFHPRRAPEGRALVRERTGDDRPYLIFMAAISPRKNLHAVRGALQRMADLGFPMPSSSLLGPAGRLRLEELRRQALPRSQVTRVGFSGSPIPPMKSCQPCCWSDRRLPTEPIRGIRAPRPRGHGEWRPCCCVEPRRAAGGCRTSGLGGRSDGRRRRAGPLGDIEIRSTLSAWVPARRCAESFTWDRTANGWLHVLRYAAQERT